MTADQLAERAGAVSRSGFVPVTQSDREEMAVGLYLQGYDLSRAVSLAMVLLEDNDGALQMLARRRLSALEAGA